jgi:hypothetical protein
MLLSALKKGDAGSDDASDSALLTCSRRWRHCNSGSERKLVRACKIYERK